MSGQPLAPTSERSAPHRLQKVSSGSAACTPGAGTKKRAGLRVGAGSHAGFLGVRFRLAHRTQLAKRRGAGQTQLRISNIFRLSARMKSSHGALCVSRPASPLRQSKHNAGVCASCRTQCWSLIGVCCSALHFCLCISTCNSTLVFLVPHVLFCLLVLHSSVLHFYFCIFRSTSLFLHVSLCAFLALHF